MDKLHICHLLLLVVTWIALSSQRPAPDADVDLRDASQWIADYDERLLAPAPDDDDGGGDVWTKTQRAHGKRGFSMLTRWKPFNALGKQRTSIRNIGRGPYAPAAAAAPGDFEMVSAETRALSRPSGQPLRWG